MTVKANWLVFARRMLAWAGCMLAAASWAAPPVPVPVVAAAPPVAAPPVAAPPVNGRSGRGS